MRLCYYVRYTFLLKECLQLLAVQRSFVVAVNRQRLTQYLETLHDCFINIITIFILDRDYVAARQAVVSTGLDQVGPNRDCGSATLAQAAFVDRF